MRHRGLAALAAAGSVIAGCGSTPPPSVIQLRSEGASICTHAGRALTWISTPRSAADAEAFLRRGIGVLAPELRRLRALSPPASVADVYRSGLEALADELQALRGAVRDLAHGHDAVLTFHSLQQKLGPLETQADNAWQALQMASCIER